MLTDDWNPFTICKHDTAGQAGNRILPVGRNLLSGQIGFPTGFLLGNLDLLNDLVTM